MNKIFIFSYGSNSSKQIKERLSITENLISKSAHIDNHTRIFAGYSKKWNGAVASLYPCKNKKTYGIIVEITKEQLSLLSEYEKGYHLEIKKIISNKIPIECYVYIKDNNRYIKPPSQSYIDAINITLNERKKLINQLQLKYQYENHHRNILIRYIKDDKIHLFTKFPILPTL